MNIDNDKTLAKSYVIGKYGIMRKNYLQEYDVATYYELISNNMIIEHLIQFDKTLNNQVKILVKCMIKNACEESQLNLNNENEFAVILIKCKKAAEEIVMKQHFNK